MWNFLYLAGTICEWSYVMCILKNAMLFSLALTAGCGAHLRAAASAPLVDDADSFDVVAPAVLPFELKYIKL